ncbi:MmgE/PrpD family protein [Chloroflexota bacterium]
MNETRELARLATELKYEDMPPDVIKKAEELILDQFGVQVSASTRPWCQAAYKQVRDLNSSGSSTILNYGDKVGAELAAFVNGTFGHGFEIDDTYPQANLHPGCVIVAAALALGERELIDGKTFLLAVVTGYEVMGKIAKSLAPSIINRGHHPTATLGPMGAAATAGKILGFNEEQMLNAISIAACLGSGLMEFTFTGGSVKRIYGGIGAQGGIKAALLAQRGLTGSLAALEGEAGLCKAFSDECRLEEITSDFGKKWVVPDIIYKRYHTDYMIQAPIDALLKLRNEHKIKPDDVEEIVVMTNKTAFRVIGAITKPKDITGAQFSASFCMGMALVRGSCSFKDFVDESLSDPAILDVARKVTLELDEEIQAAYPAKRGGGVRLKLKDGTCLEEKVLNLKGTPYNPMTREEVEDKFRGLATIVLSKEKVEEVVKAVRRLDELKDVSVLCSLLVR